MVHAAASKSNVRQCGFKLFQTGVPSIHFWVVSHFGCLHLSRVVSPHMQRWVQSTYTRPMYALQSFLQGTYMCSWEPFTLICTFALKCDPEQWKTDVFSNVFLQIRTRRWIRGMSTTGCNSALTTCNGSPGTPSWCQTRCAFPHLYSLRTIANKECRKRQNSYICIQNVRSIRSDVRCANVGVCGRFLHPFLHGYLWWKVIPTCRSRSDWLMDFWTNEIHPPKQV